MLSNIIGTLLAFVTIMLMLSLIVTSLVQFFQATLRLRARNLLVGVAAVIQHHHPQPVGATGWSLRGEPHLLLAAQALNKTEASLKKLPDPNATRRILMGPPVSWVDSDDLARAVVETLPAPAPVGQGNNAPPPGVPATPAAATTEADVQKTFEAMEPAMSKRFQFIMRVWTVACSFVIALVFQLSTPDLLKELPSADAKRQAILAAVPNLASDTTRKLAYSTDNVLEESIKRLAEKFPDYKELFEEVSGDSTSKQAMMNEMRGVLGSRPNRDAVLSEYSSIIDSLSQTAASAAYATSKQLIDQLDTFGISPKLDNFEFYVAAPPTTGAGKTSNRVIHWNHIAGVLITGILLSLGAPFWFEQLKNLSGLRDAMAPKPKT
jgi:hypothetical protein